MTQTNTFEENMSESSLKVVGIGIQLMTHVTLQASQAIESADEVFYLVADSASEQWIKNLNPNSKSLAYHYSTQISRSYTYSSIVAEVLDAVKRKLNVCFVSYGHPGVYACPMHEAVRQAKLLGYNAVMYPAISCEDVLFADLGVDPGQGGCQSFEATDFLVSQKKFDTTSHLILLQIGVIGITTFPKELPNRKGLRLLSEYLLDSYKVDHQVALYEASPFVILDARIEWFPLSRLPEMAVTIFSTLYVPPLEMRPPDTKMLSLIGLSNS
jgi:uncharacterized protein YabN with tetrapyrrole methylase and pyrophosphatase domain